MHGWAAHRPRSELTTISLLNGHEISNCYSDRLVELSDIIKHGRSWLMQKLKAGQSAEKNVNGVLAYKGDICGAFTPQGSTGWDFAMPSDGRAGPSQQAGPHQTHTSSSASLHSSQTI